MALDSIKTLALSCCKCGTAIDESAVFSFGGGFACERCVRNHYRNSPRDEVEFELQSRRREAIPMLKTERKKQEKLAAKKTASDKRTAFIVAKLQKLTLRCFQCGTEIKISAEINASTAFAFRGSVACEKCV